MISITAKDVPEMVHEDYMQNFNPRKEIDLCLTFEQLKEFLKHKELQRDIRLTWHFKFYVKQLFWLSWNAIHQNSEILPEKKIEMIKELDELVTFAGVNETRALVAFIKLSFFLGEISNFHLHDIFDGTSIYDDHCAQLAYDEYNTRNGGKSRPHGEPFDSFYAGQESEQEKDRKRSL